VEAKGWKQDLHFMLSYLVRNLSWVFKQLLNIDVLVNHFLTFHLIFSTR